MTETENKEITVTCNNCGWVAKPENFKVPVPREVGDVYYCKCGSNDLKWSNQSEAAKK